MRKGVNEMAKRSGEDVYVSGYPSGGELFTDYLDSYDGAVSTAQEHLEDDGSSDGEAIIYKLVKVATVKQGKFVVTKVGEKGGKS
jgi:hypothetical protein